MSITTVGSHTVSSCPYCDRLLSVSGLAPGEALQAILDLFNAHLSECASCHDNHVSTVRGLFGSLATNPLLATFLGEIFPAEQRDGDGPITVAKITRCGEPLPHYIEAADMVGFSIHFGETIGDRFVLEWVAMAPNELEALPQLRNAEVAPQGSEQSQLNNGR